MKTITLSDEWAKSLRPKSEAQYPELLLTIGQVAAMFGYDAPQHVAGLLSLGMPCYCDGVDSDPFFDCREVAAWLRAAAVVADDPTNLEMGG